mgnify:FL=1|jgi:hypothetical protein
MAVINQYKFYGKYIEAAESGTLLAPLISETVIIKSFRVTNKSASNAPTLTIKNNGFSILWTTALATGTSVELLSLPLVVVGDTLLTYTTVGDATDGVVIGISYLNIKKEVTV